MNRGFCFLAGLLLMTTSAVSREPLRVACIGDSITYGDQLADRDSQSYPAVLQRLAAGRFVAGNFGVNATTALQGTGRAWTDTSACREALAFAPDLAVVMLGINDLAFPDSYARYPADLRALVARLQALPSAPRVFLCTLTPIAPAEQQAYVNQLIRDTFNPAIRAAAAASGATVIDIASAFPNRIDLLPDGLHPSPAGAEILARTILAALAAPPAATPQIQPAPAAGPVDLSIRNEALAARQRAQQWLATHPAPADLPPPLAFFDAPESPSSADLLPLLDGAPAPAARDLYFAFAALAAHLDRAGAATVFLPDGRPVAWRAALLHQLVQRQKNDARGGGFWQDPAAPDPSADPARATAYALQALATALGD